MSNRKYNIVIFGATGITAKYVILEIIRFLQSADAEDKFTWSIAGRSAAKMDNVLQQLSKSTGNIDLLNIDKIVADVEDENSLIEMARSCDVILNCVGPYILYGEQVVKACVQEGTHHLDLSAEDQFLENIQLKYNKAAQATGSLIIGATGFGSIPSDFGGQYLTENFDGVLNSVQSYISVFDGYKAAEFHEGTWKSVSLSAHLLSELDAVWNKLYPDPYYKFVHKISSRFVQYSPEMECWCVPSIIPDARTMERSQRFKYHELKTRPVQTQVLFQAHNYVMALVMYLALTMFLFFAKCKLTFQFMQKYPKLSSFGYVSSGEIETKTNQTFTFTVVGKGWDKSSEPEGPPNKILTLKVQGNNAATEGTAKFMVHSAITVIKERNKLPISGGVYTPAIAFAGSNLAERLNKNGVTFTLSTKTLLSETMALETVKVI